MTVSRVLGVKDSVGRVESNQSHPKCLQTMNWS